MHSRLFGTSILALTLASILNVACTKSSDNPGTTGTTGMGAGVRVSQIDIGRSLAADKTSLVAWNVAKAIASSLARCASELAIAFSYAFLALA